MKCVSIKNKKRQLYTVLFVAVVIFFALALAVTVLSALELESYRAENLTVVSGGVAEIARPEKNRITLRIEGRSELFQVYIPIGGNALYAAVEDTVALHDTVTLSVIKDGLGGESHCNIVALSVNGTEIVGVEAGLSAHQKSCRAELFTAISLSVLFLAAACLFFCLQKHLPKQNEIPHSRALQSLLPNNYPNPVHQKVQRIKRILSPIFYLLLIGSYCMRLSTAENSIAYVVFVCILMAFLLACLLTYFLTYRRIRASEIALFVARYDYNTSDAPPPAPCFSDLSLDACLIFRADGLIVTYAAEEHSGAEPFWEMEEHLTLPYDSFDFYAESEYRPTGDMMSIYINIVPKTAEISEELGRFLCPSTDELIFMYPSITHKDLFLMLPLDRPLFHALQECGITVKNLSDCIENRETLMQTHCRWFPKKSFTLDVDRRTV